MASKFTRNKYAVLVIGLFVIGIGLIPSSSQVTCGNNVMQPGDTCAHTTDGITRGTNTYEQEKAAQKNSNKIILIVGGLITVAGIGVLGYNIAAGRRTPAGPTDTAAAQNAIISGS